MNPAFWRHLAGSAAMSFMDIGSREGVDAGGDHRGVVAEDESTLAVCLRQ
jgi:hypothetical protein